MNEVLVDSYRFFFGVSEVNAEVKKFINTWSADMKKIIRGTDGDSCTV